MPAVHFFGELACGVISCWNAILRGDICKIMHGVHTLEFLFSIVFELCTMPQCKSIKYLPVIPFETLII